MIFCGILKQYKGFFDGVNLPILKIQIIFK